MVLRCERPSAPRPRSKLLLTRLLSLRIIVIVAALSVVALVITLGAWVWFGVTRASSSASWIDGLTR